MGGDLGLVLIVVGAAVLLPYLDPRDNRARTAVFAVCILFTWRYVLWRFSATIPPLSWRPESLFAWGFALLEALNAVASTLSFGTLARTRDRSPAVDAQRAWLDRLPRPLRVGVLIPTYNEEEPILRRSIVGALGIDFPGLSVFVLDDGQRPWLERLCAAEGAHYITRPDRSGAKAGNLNHAFEILRCLPDPPEFLAVFDADFVAQPNFLKRTMPLFADDTVALVQTPQHFFNEDPIQSNLLVGKVWPDEQRFFFEHVMPAKDAWGAAFCCGTSWVVRVRALAEIGGMPTESVTEDFLLTLALDRRGWRTVYLNEWLSAGLAPEGVGEYLSQRGRWCLGMMQIIRSRFGPLCRDRLSLRYRIALIDILFYWTASFAFKFASLVVPIVYWFTGLYAVSAPFGAVIGHFLPYYLAVILALQWATGGIVQPVLSDTAHLLTMFPALKSAVAGLSQPYARMFNVTAKGGRRDRLVVHWRLVAAFGGLAGLTLAGMIYGTFADFAPSHVNYQTQLINLYWSGYNIVVLLTAVMVSIELPRFRREERFAAAETARICVGDRIFWAPLADISAAGARILAPQPAAAGSIVTLGLERVGALPARVVAGSETMFAVEFLAADSTRDALIRELFSGRYRRAQPRVRVSWLLRALLTRLWR